MKKWIKAARLRTLPLSLSGIILGASYAYPQYHFQKNYWAITVFCMLTTLFFQVLSNYANDYGDAVKGTDNENRVGPKRAIQSGEIGKKEMKKAIIITSILSLLSSILVIFLSFGNDNFIKALLYLFISISCISAAIKYTVGSSAYGYRGLGDVFVFIFFGLVSTLGTYYLYGHHLEIKIAFPAIGVGLLSTAVLNMNNMRDIENDALMNKNTLVVKMGFERAKIYHYTLIILAMLSFLIFSILIFRQMYLFVYIIGFLPLIKNIKKVKEIESPRNLDSELKRISLTTFFISLLVSIAIIINSI